MKSKFMNPKCNQNIATAMLALAVSCLLSSCGKIDEAASANRLSTEEKRAGWELLFDGKSLESYRIFSGDSDWRARWHIEGDSLTLKPRDPDNAKRSKVDLVVSSRAFSDFEFNWDWRLAKGGNGGVFYRVAEKGYPMPWHTGLEYQMLDNANHKEGEIDTHRAGDLYDLVAAPQDHSKGAPDWNTSRIVAKGGHFEHWINGSKVVDIDVDSEEWNEAYEKSKYAEFPDVGRMKQGIIVMQDHGDALWLRNMKIREL